VTVMVSGQLNRSGSNRESSLLTSATKTAFFASTDGLFLGRVGTYDPEDTSIGDVLTHTALSGAFKWLCTPRWYVALLALRFLRVYTRSCFSYNLVSRVFRACEVQQYLRSNLRRSLDCPPQLTTHNTDGRQPQQLPEGPSKPHAWTPDRSPIPSSAPDYQHFRTHDDNRACSLAEVPQDEAPRQLRSTRPLRGRNWYPRRSYKMLIRCCWGVTASAWS
jgi:hypothetical protein